MPATKNHTRALIDALEHEKWRALLLVQFDTDDADLSRNLYRFDHAIWDALKRGVMESGLFRICATASVSWSSA